MGDGFPLFGKWRRGTGMSSALGEQLLADGAYLEQHEEDIRAVSAVGDRMVAFLIDADLSVDESVPQDRFWVATATIEQLSSFLLHSSPADWRAQPQQYVAAYGAWFERVILVRFHRATLSA